MVRFEPPERDLNELPNIGTTVLAVIQHWSTKERLYTVLKRVDESDCDFRTVDDNSELSYNFNVIEWDYLEEIN